MANPIKMQLKKSGNPVDVYGFIEVDGKLKAVVFDPNMWANGNQGIHTVDAKTLLPWNVDYTKKTTRTSTMSRIKTIHCEFECTDGQVFNCKEDAYKHEREIVALELGLTEEEVERYAYDLNKIPNKEEDQYDC